MNVSQRDAVIKDTLAIAEGLSIGLLSEGRERAMATIAAALIMSQGMQTVSDVGPALEKIANAIETAR